MTDFFNVIIGEHKRYAFPEDRIFEETQKSVSTLFKDEDGDPDFHKLQQLPTIMTPEYDEDRPATARIGYLGQDNYDPYLETVVASFPAFKLNAFLPRNGWLGQRTRWIVLRGDPYRMLGNLQQQQITPVDSPFVMKFPEVAIEGRRIGVMMPFGVVISRPVMTQCTKRLKMQLQRVILNAFERMNMYLLKTLRKIF